MAKILRKLQKLFASSGSAGQFGSGQLGTKVVATDLDILQALSAFLNGWSSAVISGEKLPPLEEMNCLAYIFSQQLGYIFQDGIPEYLATKEYHQNSIVKKAGTNEIYSSLITPNLGQTLVDGANWQFLGDLSYLREIGQISAFAVNTPTNGWLECDGSAISRTVYAKLFAVIGTTWGIGDGSTTFNIPETRGEFLRGWDNGRGIDSGRAFASAQSQLIASHQHTIGGSGTPVAAFYGGGNYTEAWDGNASTNKGTNSGADNQSGDTRPRNMAVMYCIKY